MRKTMSLEEEIDDPAAFSKSANRRVPVIRARHVVYLQLLATILSVFLWECEQWGYSGVPGTGLSPVFFDGIVGALLISALLFPFAVFALLRERGQPERWAWVAAPLSLVMSGTQILALLPPFE
jgi:hypothetical protein